MNYAMVTGRPAGGNPLAFLEAVGRAVMDFGFGSFLDKFEEHFGRLAVKGLLTIIGLAVVSYCGSLVFTTFLQPVYNFITGNVTHTGFWWEFMSNNIQAGMMIWAVVLLKKYERDVHNPLVDLVDELESDGSINPERASSIRSRLGIGSRTRP